MGRVSAISVTNTTASPLRCCNEKPILEIIYDCSSHQPDQTYLVCINHLQLKAFSTKSSIKSVKILGLTKTQLQECMKIVKFKEIIQITRTRKGAS